MTPAGPGPGWYADPFDPGKIRFWDGSTWTTDVSPRAGQAPGQTRANVLGIVALVTVCLGFALTVTLGLMRTVLFLPLPLLLLVAGTTLAVVVHRAGSHTGARTHAAALALAAALVAGALLVLGFFIALIGITL